MKKEQMKQIAEKYGMEILRHPITSEAWALYKISAEPIPELDALCESAEPSNIGATRSCIPGEISYKIACPTNWFDLFGWC